MKYEMIFGDESLFDGAPDGIVALRFVNGSGGKLLHCKEGQIDGLVEADFINHPIVAMRRIIKEPRRWTWEDKKARRLPEVGVVVVGGATKCEYEISKITPTHIVLIGTDKFVPLVGCYTHEEFISCNNPLETPAEKSQREEDEFIDSLKSVEIHDGTVSPFFNQGARAAYRKLKGGE